MEFRKTINGEWPEGTAYMRKVVAPVRHEGVANALRMAYLPRCSDVPKDLAALLAKLG